MIISASSLGDCVSQAVDLCANQTQMNLVIESRIPVPTRDEFIMAYRDKARDWQASARPRHLKFNHGEYIFRHGDALAFLENELSRKATSNRACISLVDGRDIMGSGDGALPSLMIIQAGFQPSSQETLYVTAYFRALEVQQFLPINLAELTLLADRLASRFPTISHADLTLFAFRAHLNPGFGTHMVAEIDQATRDDIVTAVGHGVSRKKWDTVTAWLVDKRRRESVIDTQGLATLATELGSTGTPTGPRGPGEAEAGRAASAVAAAVAELTQLEVARSNGTHGSTLDTLQQTFEEHLDEAVRRLSG